MSFPQDGVLISNRCDPQIINNETHNIFFLIGPVVLRYIVLVTSNTFCKEVFVVVVFSEILVLWRHFCGYHLWLRFSKSPLLRPSIDAIQWNTLFLECSSRATRLKRQRLVCQRNAILNVTMNSPVRATIILLVRKFANLITEQEKQDQRIFFQTGVDSTLNVWVTGVRLDSTFFFLLRYWIYLNIKCGHVDNSLNSGVALDGCVLIALGLCPPPPSYELQCNVRHFGQAYAVVRAAV